MLWKYIYIEDYDKFVTYSFNYLYNLKSVSIGYIKRDLKSIHQNLTVVNHKIYK